MGKPRIKKIFRPKIHGGTYIAVHCPIEYWGMGDSSGYVLEHRLVMAMHLKRPLLKTEHIHHKDGDPQNNKIDNLQLMTNGEHMALSNLERRERGGKRKIRSCRILPTSVYCDKFCIFCNAELIFAGHFKYIGDMFKNSYVCKKCMVDIRKNFEYVNRLPTKEINKILKLPKRILVDTPNIP